MRAFTGEFGANTREFGANTREFGAFTREFGANTHEFDAFTREFGGNTRETQKRICLFPLLCTMNVVFKEELVVLTSQLKMILVLTVLGSIVKAAKQLFNSIVRAIKNNGNICHESSGISTKPFFISIFLRNSSLL
ncbi:hypothetical protein P4647_05935 [Peribacillus frigoritolerans]|uniref:hypothetical protein n=1 Tax=Peribacillus frigoritolerans TaxID=450367 RepID=UPI002E201EC9|nr:hypothetical protein [Peribacillus frigoritolerans]